MLYCTVLWVGYRVQFNDLIDVKFPSANHQPMQFRKIESYLNDVNYFMHILIITELITTFVKTIDALIKGLVSAQVHYTHTVIKNIRYFLMILTL